MQQENETFCEICATCLEKTEKMLPSFDFGTKKQEFDLI